MIAGWLCVPLLVAAQPVAHTVPLDAWHVLRSLQSTSSGCDQVELRLAPNQPPAVSVYDGVIFARATSAATTEPYYEYAAGNVQFASRKLYRFLLSSGSHIWCIGNDETSTSVFAYAFATQDYPEGVDGWRYWSGEWTEFGLYVQCFGNPPSSPHPPSPPRPPMPPPLPPAPANPSPSPPPHYGTEVVVASGGCAERGDVLTVPDPPGPGDRQACNHRVTTV